MTPPSRIALIGYGEVGQTLAADLRDRAAGELIAWDVQFVDPQSSPYKHAQKVGMRAARSAIEAVAGAAVIISAVTTAHSLAAAESALPELSNGAVFLDLNSAAPSVKQRVAHAIDARGGRYVEAAVMAPIQPRGVATPMLLGGPHAEAFLPTARALGLSAAQLYSPIVGPASAAKMCRSVIIKGVEALLTESLLAARHYGVEAAVLASLNDLLPNPDWPAQAHYMLTRSLLHGRRRSEEMRYVAQTVTEAGIDPWMSEASVHRQAWAGEHSAAAAATGDSLSDLLDSLLQSHRTGEVHAC